MPEDLAKSDPTVLTNELDDALRTLESALATAGGAATVIRNALPQIVTLAQVVSEMETTMARVRDQLGAPPETIPPPPVPQEESVDVFRAPTPEVPEVVEPTAESTYEEKIETSEPAPETPSEKPAETQSETSEQTSNCLVLDVSTKAGSLDLRAVDGSVNENTAVVDVALLDYDGRHATLKVWIDASANPITVRDSLLESLQRRLADDKDAEVRIDFEASSAA